MARQSESGMRADNSGMRNRRRRPKKKAEQPKPLGEVAADLVSEILAGLSRDAPTMRPSDRDATLRSLRTI